MTKYNYYQPKKQYAFSENGKVVGIYEKGMLKKTVIGSKHMLKEPKGWAWDTCILAQAESRGYSITEVYDKESGIVYQASFDDFHKHGVRFNRGYGPQMCLPLQHWRVSNPKVEIKGQEGKRWGVKND
jgi:hypothetical protein